MNDANARPLAVVDIDGVVADVRHRLPRIQRRPKDWDGFFAEAVEDPLLEEGRRMVDDLAREHEVVFLTGRPERCRRDTEAWLERHGMGGHELVMRPAGNRRPAAQTKVALLRDLAGEREVAVVVDDDPLVIRAMGEGGYPTLQATWVPRPPELHEAQEVEGRS